MIKYGSVQHKSLKRKSKRLHQKAYGRGKKAKKFIKRTSCRICGRAATRYLEDKPYCGMCARAILRYS